MANPYLPQTWVDGSGGGTPISAARLNVIEAGIRDAHYMAGARVFHSLTQSILNTTFTTLAFNSERFDTESNAASTIHDTVTNNSRLTCRTAGVYLITATVEFAANATGQRQVYIDYNNTAYIAADSHDASAAGGTIVTVPTVYQLAVGDFVFVQVWQNSGGALNVNTTANYSPEFSMVRVG